MQIFFLLPLLAVGLDFSLSKATNCNMRLQDSGRNKGRRNSEKESQYLWSPLYKDFFCSRCMSRALEQTEIEAWQYLKIFCVLKNYVESSEAIKSGQADSFFFFKQCSPNKADFLNRLRSFFSKFKKWNCELKTMLEIKLNRICLILHCHYVPVSVISWPKVQLLTQFYSSWTKTCLLDIDFYWSVFTGLQNILNWKGPTRITKSNTWLHARLS